MLGINPFDQPNVQEAKDATSRVLAEGAEDQPDATDDELRALLAGLGAAELPGDHGLRRAVARTSTPR